MNQIFGLDQFQTDIGRHEFSARGEQHVPESKPWSAYFEAMTRRLEIDKALIMTLLTRKASVFVVKDFFSSSFETFIYGKRFSTISRTAAQEEIKSLTAKLELSGR
jgi:hypothetical protein